MRGRALDVTDKAREGVGGEAGAADDIRASAGDVADTAPDSADVLAGTADDPSSNVGDVADFNTGEGASADGAPIVGAGITGSADAAGIEGVHRGAAGSNVMSDIGGTVAEDLWRRRRCGRRRWRR